MTHPTAQTLRKLLLGSNSELRAVAEGYASNGGKQEFLTDFVAARNKVMELDRN
ncbi:MAG: hypothetical protein ACK4E7_00025 [Permianibacter sp.]